MKNILIISALAGVLALSSCRRDDLYYATVDPAPPSVSRPTGLRRG